MAFSYLTLQRATEGIYKEKGSKFLAFGYPVESEEEIRAHIERLKKKFHDARHHCYAWVLGASRDRFRTFDDGEPPHTAGDPILGQLRQYNLTNVLLVVVRYFGGTKLGAGNLAAAYKAAARDALENAQIVEREVTREYIVEFPYLATADVMKLVKAFDLQICEQHFEENCRIRIRIGVKVEDAFLKKISVLQAIKVDVKVLPVDDDE
ncbi:MAG TPA: YigZ family protein [Cyclobacteriaceae bacterium]|nr:YigZ family protein [Cyclobacteriaceae bacterium]